MWTTVGLNSLPPMIDAGLIQISAFEFQDQIGLSPAEQSPLLYGPVFPAASSPPVPMEDLYDEGAGAVWGSPADEGTQGANLPGSLSETGGDTGTTWNAAADDGTDGAMVGYGEFGVNDAGFDDMGDLFGDADFPGDTGLGDTSDGDGDTGAGVDGMTDAGTDGNHQIVAEDNYATTNEDTPVDVYVLENDYDSAGHFLTVANVFAWHGTATVDSSGVLRFTPFANFHGTASVTYRAFDGTEFSNAATVSIVVSPINDAPTVTNPGNATFTEGDEILFQVPGTDADLPDDFLRWSGSGTWPPGIAIEIVTGRLVGKLNYSSAGTYTITATVTDSAGATASTTFVWTVLDAGFDTFTATEMGGTVSLPNSITVPGPQNVLYVAPYNSVSLSVAALPPKLRANLSDVRYEMTHDLTHFVGDFDPTPVLQMGDAGDVYTVTAYLDEDFDTIRDAAEFQLTLIINVIDFGSAKVFGGRVAGGTLYPGEDLLFIKPGELFDVTSTFEYKLVPEPDTVLGTGAIVRGQLIRPTSGYVIASGGAIGDSFNVLLTSAMVGPAQARFYADANFNGAWDSGEMYRMSNAFEIVERNELTRTYQYSLLLSGLTQASIQADVDSSMALALCKDSDDDWRAAVYTTVTPATDHFFAPSNSRPDPADSRAKISLHLNANDGLTLLTAMSDPFDGNILGIAHRPGNSLAIDWDSKSVDVVVHELGHNLGLIHNGLGANYIMEAVDIGSNDHLTFSEAQTYSGVSTSPPSPGPDAKLTAAPPTSISAPVLSSPTAVRSLPKFPLYGFSTFAGFTTSLPPFAGLICAFDSASIRLPSRNFRTQGEETINDSLQPGLAGHKTAETVHSANQFGAEQLVAMTINDLAPIKHSVLIQLLGNRCSIGRE